MEKTKIPANNWGVEVRPNVSLRVPLKEHEILHITQVALRKVKNRETAKHILVTVHYNGKETVIANLSQYELQVKLHLVFPQTMELSHDWKDESVFLDGYIAGARGHPTTSSGCDDSMDDDDDDNDDDDDDDDVEDEDGDEKDGLDSNS